MKQNHSLICSFEILATSVGKCVDLKRKVHLEKVFFGALHRPHHYPEGSDYSIQLQLSDDSPFVVVFNWAAIDNLIISSGAGNSIRLQAGKCVPCPAHCRVISAAAPFPSFTFKPEMEARLLFPPHSSLLHHYWAILCILWWKWTAGRVMIHPDFDPDLSLEKSAPHFMINHYGCLTRGAVQRCIQPLICLPAVSFGK